MQISGVALALLDVPVEHEREFNLWYDLDHLPSHVSKADVVMGRRYVAPAALQTVNGAQPSELTGGHPAYATAYFFGGELDFMSEEALDGWREMDHEITRAGRFWIPAKVVHTMRWRLGAARARASVHVKPDAIAHLAHRGIVVCIGRAASAASRGDAIEWWERTQADDLEEIPGVLGTLRFDPTGADDQDLVLHIVLCSTSSAEVVQQLQHVRERQALTGRYPAYRGVYETVAVLPYDRIDPLDYSFLAQ